MTRRVELPSDTRSPVFIGGQRRSGTTLIRVLLNRHPNIACGPESKFVQHPDFVAWHGRLAAEWSERIERFGMGSESFDRAMAALVDELFTRYQLREGKVRWAEKTPTNILRIDFLFRLFPNAQFIHLIRDPRDTYCSILDRVKSDKPHWNKFTPQRSAEDWCASIMAGKRWRSAADRYREVQYEKLAHDPEGTMRDLLAFLHEPWTPRVLDPKADNVEASDANIRRARVDATSVGRWRGNLNAGDVAVIESIAGDLMTEMGYDVHSRWQST